MEVHTQKFVVLSDLFQNCSALAELFHEDDHPHITWGGATRTMVPPKEILSWAERTLSDEWWNEEYDPNELATQVDILRSRVRTLEENEYHQILTDIEN